MSFLGTLLTVLAVYRLHLTSTYLLQRYTYLQVHVDFPLLSISQFQMQMSDLHYSNCQLHCKIAIVHRKGRWLPLLPPSPWIYLLNKPAFKQQKSFFLLLLNQELKAKKKPSYQNAPDHTILRDTTSIYLNSKYTFQCLWRHLITTETMVTFH